jgi:hypothetical protein
MEYSGPLNQSFPSIAPVLRHGARSSKSNIDLIRQINALSPEEELISVTPPSTPEARHDN